MTTHHGPRRDTPIAIVCDACDTRTEVTPDELATALTRHNNLQHDGAAVAVVAGEHFGRLAAGRAD